MIWIPVALIGCYAVFMLGPALVAYFLIFRGTPGSDLGTLTAHGAQFEPYKALLLDANARLRKLPHTDVSICAKDGVTLTGTYYDLGQAKTAIFVHGYQSDPYVNFSVQAEAFSRHGYNLFLIRQRGHEPGSKARCTMGLSERYDVAAWNDWALAQNGVTETVLYGISMGAASIAYASDLLNSKHTRALILDCGFRSPYEQVRLDCIRRHIPAFLMMPLIRLFARLFLKVDIRERTDAHLARTRIPCFFLHGTNDLTVPFETGRAVYEACASKKAFFAAENAEHTESFLSDPDRAENEIFTFLSGERIVTNEQEDT